MLVDRLVPQLRHPASLHTETECIDRDNVYR
jgi:hypothetical protein